MRVEDRLAADAVGPVLHVLLLLHAPLLDPAQRGHCAAATLRRQSGRRRRPPAARSRRRRGR
eukprot:1627624-Alexandrium_andersonii.AAC.1